MASVTMAVEGTCAAGFECVRDAFADNFAQGGEVGATVAATVEDRLVVDVWAGPVDATRTRPWARDTIVDIASLTNGLTTICAHRPVHAGLLDLEAPVARYWPEFAQAGKGTIPVHFLLSHRAGLPAIDELLPTEALYDWNRMTRALAAQKLWWDRHAAWVSHLHVRLSRGKWCGGLRGRRLARIPRRSGGTTSGRPDRT